MAKPAVLNLTDESGFFEIRLESIGGLGAHLAGQLLTQAAVLRQGFNGAHFSSYGSEKKGTPVKSFVRLCAPDQDVRTSSPVERPFVVGVFHEGLIKTEDVARGLHPNGVIIVNTTASPEVLRRRLGLETGTVGSLDATGIAVEEQTRVNTAMMGAVCRVCDFLDADLVREAIKDAFERKYPKLVESNIRTFDRGYQEVQLQSMDSAGAEGAPVTRPEPAWGYLNAPIGGTIINPGNSVRKDLTPSRQGFIPVFHREHCIDCAMCDLVCPDVCFVWEKGVDKRGRPAMVLKGIDYRYCKGCMKCVAICPTPTPALTKERETEGFADEARVPLFPAV